MVLEEQKTGVSLVLCCYNSRKRIKPTLIHISKQKFNASFNFEIILIDNASNDDTIEAAHEIWAEMKSQFPFQIVLEENPGLSNARKRGILESQYSIVLFCDDDNWLDEYYVQRSFDIMSGDSSIGILGGCGIPEAEIIPPSWFEKYRKSYALGPQAKQEGYLQNKQSIYGAGMVLRKEPLLNMYTLGFDSLLSDRKGGSLTSGGDIEICIWYKYFGYKLYYSEALSFKHFIPKERLTDTYFLQRSYDKGKVEAVFQIYRLIMNGSEVSWLAHRFLWYWEIVKRIFNYCLFSFKIISFDAKIKRRILLSSIRFRIRNFEYLKKISFLIKTNINVYSAK